MSIALEMGSDLIEESSSGFMMHHGLMSPSSCVSIFESPTSSSVAADDDDKFDGDRRFPPGTEEDGGEMAGDDGEAGLNSCSSLSSLSSSIGKNSDVSERSLSDADGDDDDDDDDETEVQSSYKGSFVSMETLEEVLPIRRGISNFYNGKSKSFASLADASSVSSMKNISKPENAYTRKRRNLLAFNHVWDKNRNSPLRSNGGGISKRPANLSRSTLALAVAMSSSESITTSEDSSSRSPPRLPPLHPQTTASFSITPSLSPRNFSPWRSFSLADLQHCATTATTSTTHAATHNKDDPQN